MAGNWAGGGTVTLDDGSRERLRCRASYAVAGAQMTMTLTCASDAYKFQLGANVVDQGGAVSGSWTETSRNISGTLQGRGGGAATSTWSRAPPASTPIFRCARPATSSRSACAPTASSGRRDLAVALNASLGCSDERE